MIGAIAGDIVGSRFEHTPTKSMDFALFAPGCRFTDGTVLTLATGSAIGLYGYMNFESAYRSWGRQYPNAGYGRSFRAWLASESPKPYGSYGNGSAMRVSPIGWITASPQEAVEWARLSAIPTHDHPRGILGAQAVALALHLAHHGTAVDEIRRHIVALTGYSLDRTVEDIRGSYSFDVTCDGSVPEAIICALESTSWEHAVRMAVSLGGNADTQAAIAGGIAEALHHGIPAPVAKLAAGYLDEQMRQHVRRTQYEIYRATGYQAAMV